MLREDTKEVPKLIAQYLPSSDMWKSEGGNLVTNCVTVLLPNMYADCYMVVRVGYSQGWEAALRFGKTIL